VKDSSGAVFFGLGVLARDAGIPYSLGPKTLPGDALVGEAVALRLLVVPEALPSRSRSSVDLRMSVSVESVDRCRPLCLCGVVGADRTGMTGGLTIGCGIFEAPYTYPMVTDGLMRRLSLLETRVGLGGCGRSLEDARSWAYSIPVVVCSRLSPSKASVDSPLAPDIKYGYPWTV
jgi:hypothetical protein